MIDLLMAGAVRRGGGFLFDRLGEVSGFAWMRNPQMAALSGLKTLNIGCFSFMSVFSLASTMLLSKKLNYLNEDLKKITSELTTISSTTETVKALQLAGIESNFFTAIQYFQNAFIAEKNTPSDQLQNNILMNYNIAEEKARLFFNTLTAYIQHLPQETILKNRENILSLLRQVHCSASLIAMCCIKREMPHGVELIYHSCLDCFSNVYNAVKIPCKSVTNIIPSEQELKQLCYFELQRQIKPALSILKFELTLASNPNLVMNIPENQISQDDILLLTKNSIRLIGNTNSPTNSIQSAHCGGSQNILTSQLLKKQSQNETGFSYQQIGQCRDAAEKGNPVAQYYLGIWYYQGQGVSKNFTMAINWLTKSAEQNEPNAQAMLGSIYYTGKIVAKNDVEAIKWLHKAAEQNHIKAQALLGTIYFYGKNVRQNYPEAFKWLSNAAEYGNPTAQSMLGAMYYNGYGVAQNFSTAFNLLKNAAEQGNGKAQATIAHMYEHGEGVKRDLAQAKYWYNVACKNGIQMACSALNRL